MGTRFLIFRSGTLDAWKVKNRAPMLGGNQINESQTKTQRMLAHTQYCKSVVFSNTFCAWRLACVQATVRSPGAPNLIIIVQNRQQVRCIKFAHQKIVKSSFPLEHVCKPCQARNQEPKLVSNFDYVCRRFRCEMSSAKARPTRSDFFKATPVDKK